MSCSTCECCIVCASKCQCGSCIVCLNDSFNISVSSSVDCENVSNQQLTLLFGNLIDFIDVLIEEGTNCVDDFNVDIIKIIVENSS